MKVELLERAMVNSDLGVVNAARCSFDKESYLFHRQPQLEPCDASNKYCNKNHWYMKPEDIKLITYLAQHEHWTPFAHAQEVFQFNITTEELLDFFAEANLAGFEWLPFDYDVGGQACDVVMRGSLYAWLTQGYHLPSEILNAIDHNLSGKYPISFRAIKGEYNRSALLKGYDLTHSTSDGDLMNDERLDTYTLRIAAPIFVKRQLETHRRNFVMTDIEDWSQNEVSRRYVDSEPEFYVPQIWRLQSKEKKQGSSGEADATDQLLCKCDLVNSTDLAKTYYDVMNKRGIAHEQSRMILPLSTYTTWWWTGSRRSWQRLLHLRLREDVQSETREICQMIHNTLDFEKAIVPLREQKENGEC